MKEFKGTKGEWSVSQELGFELDVIHENGDICWLALSEEPLQEKLANAKLIAAAPELLEALLEIKKILKKEWPKQEWDDFANEETSFTKAINKALN